MGVAGPDEGRRAVDSLTRHGAGFIKVYRRLAPETYRAIAAEAATIEPARFLGAADSMGTGALGKVADLVLLDANPLENIRNTARIAAVISGGRVYQRPALDSLLAAGRERARSAAGR
jgi:cytosine/adenosine deaminase-related metal-dependent hydrolase